MSPRWVRVEPMLSSSFHFQWNNQMITAYTKLLEEAMFVEGCQKKHIYMLYIYIYIYMSSGCLIQSLLRISKMKSANEQNCRLSMFNRLFYTSRKIYKPCCHLLPCLPSPAFQKTSTRVSDYVSAGGGRKTSHIRTASCPLADCQEGHGNIDIALTSPGKHDRKEISKLWPSGIGAHLGRSQLQVRFLEVSDMYHIPCL